MSNVYKYKRLPGKDSIRVLILAPGKDDEPLSGVLEVMHLGSHRRGPFASLRDKIRRKTSSEDNVPDRNAHIKYEAISYVWGPDEKNRIILLSGKTHQITANLSDALHQCRRTDQPRALWADSICIDQQRPKEKNPQVYMMGRIYAFAQSTLICLGTDPENRDHARDALEVISDANRMIQETFQSPNFSWELDSFPWPDTDDPLVNDSRWRSMSILVNKPWFSRAWVVQEAALGHDTRILWAGCDIRFLDLLRVDIWYNLRVRDVPDQPPRVIWAAPNLLRLTLIHDQNSEARVFFISESQIEDLDILQTLHNARDLGLKDPRDRVYAFMALPFVRNPMPVLIPDYERDYREVYRDFTVKYLEHTSDLNFLCYVTYIESGEESRSSTIVSSWVPRWDQSAWDVGPEGRSDITNFGQTSAIPSEVRIFEARNRAPIALQVRAVIFDAIRLLTRRFDSSMTIEDLITVWSQLQTRADSASGQHEAGSDYDSLALLSSLTNGYLSGAGYQEWAPFMKLYSRFLQDSGRDSGSPGSSRMSLEIQPCHQYLMTTAHGGHIFLLKSGYYGFGSWAVRPDDICAFVFGVRMPLILREFPGAGARHYKVIGPAFIVSKRLDEETGLPLGLNDWGSWVDWKELREGEGWMDWGLRKETIILR